MQAVIAEVNAEVAERDELIEYIAIALLTKKNLFILGDTGQAKSYAINEFRKRITGAKQFERLLSKQTDEEALFGRIDLKSLIDGNPKMITTGKIPDSHIIFLDETWKSNEGVLNSLLTAMNERRYTNESETVDIPAISFMGASNEIPNFSDPAEKILRPLYDRFELKVVTRYIENRDTRLAMLSRKQSLRRGQNSASITLDELYTMQGEVSTVTIPADINELMDDILCALREKGIHVSDRKYLNYYPIAQAKAWLSGRNTVQPADLTILKAYLWTTVEEISVIQQVLERFCVNPLQEKLHEIDLLARDSYDEFIANVDASPTKALIKLRGELVRLYGMQAQLIADAPDQEANALITAAIDRLESLSKSAHERVNFTYAPLHELEKLQ
jgi:MoxR-like ATPase